MVHSHSWHDTQLWSIFSLISALSGALSGGGRDGRGGGAEREGTSSEEERGGYAESRPALPHPDAQRVARGERHLVYLQCFDVV